MFTRLYLHIPFCIRKCPYCAFVSQNGTSGLEDYVELLLAEMELVSRCCRPAAALDSVYFGGGTPSLLPPRQVNTLLEEIDRRWSIGADAEITLEANPGSIDQQRLGAFRAAGVNRLSLGIQSFNDEMLTTLGRIHDAHQGRQAFSAARAAGFSNIGIDLIHALPGQTREFWRSDLTQTFELGPEHISIYGLTVEEGTPFDERYRDDTLLPDDELSALMFETADDLLTTDGYRHYEIANYALPGCHSRHNSGYWRRDGYLGLGAAAHSFLRDSAYGTRFHNPGDLDIYAAAIRNGELPDRESMVLHEEDARAEFMFLGLRMSAGITCSDFEQQFGRPIDSCYGPTVTMLINSGLLEHASGSLRLTRRGMLLSNQVFSRFLP